MNANRNKAVALATIMALTVSLGQVQAAENTSTAAAQTQYISPAIGKVNISSTADFELLNVQELEQTTDKIVSFTLRLNNKGNQGSIDFKDYWLRLQTKGGSRHAINLVNENKEQNVVPNGSYQDYRFYAKVSKTTKLSDLQFSIIAWDFSQANFERLLGTINIPSTYQKSVPQNKSYTVISDKTTFNTSIKRIAAGKNDKNYLPSLTVVMENAGAQAVTGLNFQFQLRSQTGLLYPLKSTVTETTVFNPLEKKELYLTGVVPVEAGGEGWQLVLTQSVTTDKGTVTIPLASYDLPDTKAEDVSIGSEQTFSTEDGTYTAVMTTLTRVPWEDQDILVSNISLKNNGNTPLPVPQVLGKYELDEVVNFEAEVVQFDKVLTIAPGSQIDIQFLSKIPYTYAFDKIALALEEKVGENPATELLRFRHSSDYLSIPTYGSRQSHTIEGVGKRASVTVRNKDTFSNSSGKLVNAMVDVTNLEKRYTKPGSLLGQFQTSDGAVFPATAVQTDSMIAPNGKLLILFQANLPQNVDTKSLKLLLGEAVETTKSGTNGTSETSITAYVNPVVFELPAENTTPKTETKQLDIYPYTVSFERFGTQVDFSRDSIDLEFNYTLERDSMVEADTKDRRIIIEIEDPNTGYSITHELKLDDGNVELQNAEFPNDTLRLGTHSKKLSKIDSDFKYKTQSLQTYNLNVYDQIKPGYKKLIATREIRWFGISD